MGNARSYATRGINLLQTRQGAAQQRFAVALNHSGDHERAFLGPREQAGCLELSGERTGGFLLMEDKISPYKVLMKTASLPTQDIQAGHHEASS